MPTAPRTPVPRAVPRRRAPQVRRAEILQAAHACFVDHGYHETTVDRIAECAGLSKGAIYWHFRGKRELFMALVEQYVDAMIANLEATTSTDEPAPTVVRRLFAVSLADMQQMGPMMELSLEYFCQAVREDDVRAQIERLFSRAIDVLSGALQRGVDAGEFRPVDVLGTAAMIASTLDGIALQATLNPALELERAWNSAEDVILRGLEVS